MHFDEFACTLMIKFMDIYTVIYVTWHLMLPRWTPMLYTVMVWVAVAYMHVYPTKVYYAMHIYYTIFLFKECWMRTWYGNIIIRV